MTGYKLNQRGIIEKIHVHFLLHVLQKTNSLAKRLYGYDIYADH